MKLRWFLPIFLLTHTAIASVTVTVNGTNYTIPQNNEKGWGTAVTNWIQAISANTLQPNQAVFTLSSDLDFGAAFGLKSIYYKSRSSNIAGSGVLRLANTDCISFRNSGNSADLCLTPDADGVLQYGGVDLVGTSLTQTLTNKTLLDTTTTFANAADATKKLLLDISAATTGTSTTLKPSQTVNRTLTLPDATDTLVGRATSDTLTNKSIDASEINTGKIALARGGTNADLSATGAAHNVLQQSSSGAAVTVGQLAMSDISGTASLTSQVTGILPIANGGTNKSSVTTVPFASSWAGWDSNINLSANSFISGYQTNDTTGGGTINLGASSAQQQFFTGPSSFTVKMPLASSLVLGMTYEIVNNSSGTLTVQSSGANTIQAMAPSTILELTCILTSGTTAASWNAVYYAEGTTPVAMGGTGQSSNLTQYGVVYGSTTTAMATTSAGSSGQVLTSNGSSAPTFQNVPTANSSKTLQNLGLKTTVASNALTIALKQSDGATDPASGSGAVQIAFRDATSASGDYSLVSVTSALSLVIPSGTTIGTANGAATYIYVYAMNNAGTVVLAASMAGQFDEGSVQSSSAVSGGSSITTLYSSSAQTSLAIRLIGRINISEATAGTWASNSTEVSPLPFKNAAATAATVGQVRFEGSLITCTGSPGHSDVNGTSWVSSTSHTASGQCSVSFVSGEFSGAPICTCSVNNGGQGNGYNCQTSSSSTSTNLAIGNGATPTDAQAYLICIGPH